MVHKLHAPRGDKPLAVPFPRRCRGLVNHAHFLLAAHKLDRYFLSYKFVL